MWSRSRLSRFALVGLLAWLSWRAERERSAALAAWASSQDARLAPAEAEARLRVLAAVVDRVPRFVWRAHGYDPV